MALEINIPDHILAHLQKDWEDLPRRAVEALAADGYRSGILTAAQVQEMVGLNSRWDTDAFLKSHGCYLEYGEKDLVRDMAAIQKARNE